MTHRIATITRVVIVTEFLSKWLNRKEKRNIYTGVGIGPVLESPVGRHGKSEVFSYGYAREETRSRGKKNPGTRPSICSRLYVQIS